MSPEQFVDAKNVDARADVYSFGVMLFEMASGEWPIRSQVRDANRLRARAGWQDAHFHQSPPHLIEAQHDLDEIVQMCLEKHRDDRPADFAVIRGRLSEALQARTGEVIVAPPERTNLHLTEWIAKGRSLATLGLAEAAMAAFKAALLIEPGSFPAIDGLVSQLTTLGHVEEALEAARAAASMAPNDPNVLALYGRVLKSTGQIESADRVLARADVARRAVDQSQ
jgi:tetratricopeptide (TPR) repeat protein